MSNALTVASVTAVLKHLLENRLAHQSSLIGMGDVTVTALPPDRVATGAEERAQLNLYLYHMTPNTGLSRATLFTSGEESERTTAPALALDLYYLLSAYGERDFQAEIILGQAIQLLHETPMLQTEVLRATLKAISTSKLARSSHTILASFGQSPLPDQVRELKIRPHFLSVEEVGRLWAMFQTRARLSVAYRVGAV